MSSDRQQQQQQQQHHQQNGYAEVNGEAVAEQHQQQQHQHRHNNNHIMSGGGGANTQSIADYLAQLLKDKKQLAAFPNVFLHVERLLDDEIGKVRGNLFQINGKKTEPLVLPDGSGPPVTLSEKVYVPIKEHPDFNFVGRILGPRGMTTKQLEQETGCKIMVRGKGSMRDKKKEDMNRGKPNWEHLNDELHVLITVEDAENRATVKLARAVEEVKKLLVVSEGEDELKKRQLMELAIINGTYRDSQSKTSSPGLDASRLLVGSQAALQQQAAVQAAALRNAAAAAAPLAGGAPLILSPRLQVPTTLGAGVMALQQTNGHHAGMGAAGAPPPLIAPGDTQGLIYAQYAAAVTGDYGNYMSPLLAATGDYAAAADPSGANALAAAAAAQAAAVSAAAGGVVSPAAVSVAAGGGGGKDRGGGGLSSAAGAGVRKHPYSRN